jgi:transcription initiation factor IIF auxiliary subunit
MNRRRCSFGFAALVLLTISVTAAAQDIKTANTSRSLGKDRWEWTVFIKASAKTLSTISCVEYKLPATMPKPSRKICSIGKTSQAFAISGSGFGTFDIPVLITFRKGAPLYLKHRLTFATSN